MSNDENIFAKGRPIRKVDIYRLWLIIRFRYTKTNFTAKTNIKQ